jgi:hypothetical protein
MANGLDHGCKLIPLPSILGLIINDGDDPLDSDEGGVGIEADLERDGGPAGDVDLEEDMIHLRSRRDRDGYRLYHEIVEVSKKVDQKGNKTTSYQELYWRFRPSGQRARGNRSNF